MPELKREIPTELDLAKYLDEWLKTSTLNLLTDYSGNKRQYHSDITEALAYLSALDSRETFLSAVRSRLLESLQRLNNLPRSDPFWHSTNNRPTIFKAMEFSEQLLKVNPNDIVSLWTITALALAHAGDFERGRWLQLYQLNAVGLEMVIFAAMLLEVGGSASASGFAQFAREVGSKTEVNRLLGKVAKEGGRVLGEWSRSVAIMLAEP